MNDQAIHHAAADGYQQAADTYVRGRPDYPPALEPWLRETLGLGPGRAVIDLGAGTGKFTGRLLATGAQVIAVEPVEQMRARLAAAQPEAQVLEGSAEALPLKDASVDVLVCAQAFHWFAHRAALEEIHRVLKPDGRLGLVWNVRDESVDWVAAITDIITPYEGDTPRFHTGRWRDAFSGKYFSQPEVTCFPYSHVGSPQEVIMDRFLSVSFIAALADEPKARVTAQLQTLIDTHPALKGRDTVAFPYQTQAYVCHRLA